MIGNTPIVPAAGDVLLATHEGKEVLGLVRGAAGLGSRIMDDWQYILITDDHSEIKVPMATSHRAPEKQWVEFIARNREYFSEKSITYVPNPLPGR